MGCIINHTRGTKIVLTKSSQVCKAKPITNIFTRGAWRDSRCFLIGGGFSLKDFDFNLIKNELTIGVNKSFTKFSTTINYAMDPRFYDMVTYASKQDSKYGDLHKRWLEYKGVKVFLKASRKFTLDSSVYYVNALDKKAVSFDLSKGIYSGSNSGFGALMLACCLGCKKIGLLGFDMKVDEKRNKTHFHEGYLHQDIKNMQRKLDSFAKCFNEFAPSFKKIGIDIFNLCEDSKLSCFPKITIDEFLKNS